MKNFEELKKKLDTSAFDVIKELIKVVADHDKIFRVIAEDTGDLYSRVKGLERQRDLKKYGNIEIDKEALKASKEDPNAFVSAKNEQNLKALEAVFDENPATRLYFSKRKRLEYLEAKVRELKDYVEVSDQHRQVSKLTQVVHKMIRGI